MTFVAAIVKFVSVTWKTTRASFARMARMLSTSSLLKTSHPSLNTSFFALKSRPVFPVKDMTSLETKMNSLVKVFGGGR